MKQTIINWILNLFGYAYIWIEQYKEYPDDNIVLGMPIDKDLHKMSRKQLCRYMDAVLPEKGFFDIQSTSKIRLGCQLLRNYNQLKKRNIIVPTMKWRRNEIMEWLDKNDILYDKSEDTKSELLSKVHLACGTTNK